MKNGPSFRSISHGLSRSNTIRKAPASEGLLQSKTVEEIKRVTTAGKGSATPRPEFGAIAQGAMIVDFDREPAEDPGFYYAVAPANGDFVVNGMKRYIVRGGDRRLFHESAMVVFERLG